jgi:hypothetical protein
MRKKACFSLLDIFLFLFFMGGKGTKGARGEEQGEGPQDAPREQRSRRDPRKPCRVFSALVGNALYATVAARCPADRIGPDCQWS